ncbi:unnamed protein product [Orchesella dallaii]|uniref:FHA domain-containing protein n=1 Tax=Orchesella dallaii TaxID=48710 RepID=A0ABP1QBF8_9HEXA
MEATKNGVLVRLHQPMTRVIIPTRDGIRFRIQRGAQVWERDLLPIACNSQYVSKFHCEIYRKDKAYWLKDLGSTNGTFLNGVSLSKLRERELRFGDMIGLGVSHADTNNDITDSQYFIFTFKQEDVENTEVIDLEDEPSTLPVSNGITRRGKVVQGSRKNSDEEEIEIVGEFPTASTSSSSASSPRKHRPPVPPPPIFSKSLVAKTPVISDPPLETQQQKKSSPVTEEPFKSLTYTSDTDSDTGSSEIFGFVSNNKKSKSSISPIPSTSKLLPKSDSLQKVKTTNKRVMSDTELKSVKRVKTDVASKLQSSSSSDDSSDGLGDSGVSNQRHLKSVSNYEKNSTSDLKSAVTDKGEINERLSNKPTNRQLSGSGAKTGKSTENGTIASSSADVSATISIASYKEIINQDRSTNPAAFENIVLKSEARVLIPQAIIYRGGKYLMQRELVDKINRSSKDRMERQFANALKSQGFDVRTSFECSDENIENDKKNKTKRSTLQLHSPPLSDAEEDVPEIAGNTTENVEAEASNSVGLEMDELLSTSPNRVESPPTVQDLPLPEKTTPRGIMLLNDAPPPRHAVKAQARSLSFQKSPPPFVSKLKRLLPQPNAHAHNVHTKSPSTDREFRLLSKEDQKTLRNQKLKDLELKKQLEKDNITCSPEKRSQPAKIKITSRNRNQGLMESIIGSKSKDNGETCYECEPVASKSNQPSNLPTENTTVENGESRKIPVPSSNLERHTSHSVALDLKKLDTHTFKVPSTVNSGLKNCSIQQDVSQGNNQRNQVNILEGDMTDPRRRGGMINQQRSMDSHRSTNVPVPGPSTRCNGSAANEALLKPGAGVQLSPQGGIGKTIYKEKSAMSSSVTAKSRTSSEYKTYLREDDVFTRILTWKPAWLEEQKKYDKPPPVLKSSIIGDLCVSSAVVNYQSYDDYMNTYYPLLLSETWQVISSDAAGSKLKNRDFYNNQKSSTYDVKIMNIKREGFWVHAIPKNTRKKDMERDENWCSITCESWWEHAIDRSSKKDFLILTMHGVEKLEKGSKETKKQIFGIVNYNTEMLEAIGGKVNCDTRLKKQGTCGYRFQETIQCRFSKHFTVDFNKLGQISRISCIMPKVREFGAINCLQSSPLFKNIIAPLKISDPWTPNYPPLSDHEMVSICRSLNVEQKSMIRYISNRVFSKDPELMLLHGPPGTGKTTTIVALVLQLLISYRKKYGTRKTRILVCTPSNAAIDEIMQRLVKAIKQLPVTDQKIEIIRVGDGSAKELERYTISYRSREKDEAKSNSKTLRAELESLNLEIEEKRSTLETKKKAPDYSAIQGHALLTELKDLEGKKESVIQDLTLTKKKGKIAPGQGSRHDVVRDADIICSTLSASSNSLMKNTFGKLQAKEETPILCCIVDEATQTTEPETLLPVVLKLDKLILVGDPKQLGATVLSSEAEKKNYGQSLFTRLFQHYSRKDYGLTSPVMMLKRQYRMEAEIVRFPNVFSYEGKLESHYKRPAGYPLRSYYFLNLSSGRECSSTEGQIENVDEVELVKVVLDAVHQLLANLKTQWTVGVITPYSAQRHSIRSALQR